ncbi:MAG TPA: NYN domain-containing protein [Ktedonobacteraceae bacterium]|nr:NYN domain-containing protein [Ktedonobacteraceae bacterium]
MRVLAAELIDGENIPPSWASAVHHLLEQEIQRGVSIVARLLVGNEAVVQAWRAILSSHQFQIRGHDGGKNAADEAIEAEALQLAGQGISRFYLVSNDGDFASLARRLRSQGCQVVGLGTESAARRWQTACDAFLVLRADSSGEETTLATLAPPVLSLQSAASSASLQFRTSHQRKTPVLEGDSSGIRKDQVETFQEDSMNIQEPSPKQEAFRLLYGSVQQPPGVTALLFLLLEQAVTLLAQPHSDLVGVQSLPCSVSDLVQTLMVGAQDPVISLILEEDATLRTQWEATFAFACRCNDAWEQGRVAAQTTFRDFPQPHFHALHQAHLSHLLSAWRYDPYAAPPEAQRFYVGYQPEHEHAVLQRWFQQGYLSGAEHPQPVNKVSKHK